MQNTCADLAGVTGMNLVPGASSGCTLAGAGVSGLVASQAGDTMCTLDCAVGYVAATYTLTCAANAENGAAMVATDTDGAAATLDASACVACALDNAATYAPASITCVAATCSVGFEVEGGKCVVIVGFCSSEVALAALFGALHTGISPELRLEAAEAAIRGTISGPCSEGYTGGFTAACFPDFTLADGEGRWRLDMSACASIPAYCPGKVPDTDQGIISFEQPEIDGNRELGDTAIGACRAGHSGSVAAACEADTVAHGQWVVDNRCSAIPNFCSNDPSTAVATFKLPEDATERTVGQAIEGMCRAGFVGLPRAVCMANTLASGGVWRVTDDCEELKALCTNDPSGVRQEFWLSEKALDNQKGSTLEGTCNAGYNSEERPKAVCLERAEKEETHEWVVTVSCDEESIEISASLQWGPFGPAAGGGWLGVLHGVALLLGLLHL